MKPLEFENRNVYIVGNTRGAFPGYAQAGNGDGWLMRLRVGDGDEDGDDDDDDETD